MKHTLTLTVFGAVLLGGLFFAIPAHAAGDVLAPADAATLKTALDTLGEVLDTLESRIDAGTLAVENEPAAEATLGNIRGNLVAIRGTLHAMTLAAATPPALEPVSEVAVNEPVPATPASAPDETQTASVFSAFRFVKSALAFAIFIVFVGLGFLFHRKASVSKTAQSAEDAPELALEVSPIATETPESVPQAS